MKKNKDNVWLRCLSVFLVFSLTLQPVMTYAAEEISIKTKAANKIYFFDECDDDGGGGRFLSGGGGSMTGNTVQEKIISYYSGNNTLRVKMTDYAIAGILANIQSESGFNPFRFQSDRADSSLGYGLFQFTPHSKIVGLMQSDSRTASIFNDFYNVKYSKSWDPEEAKPDDPDITEDVLDAWIEVQLDAQSDPNSSAGELQRTKVGDYRNPSNDSSMGLDYISSDLTILEAMNEAKSASDAARIWLWIYERPNDKESKFEGYEGIPGRGPLAEHHLKKVQEYLDSSGMSEDDNAENDEEDDEEEDDDEKEDSDKKSSTKKNNINESNVEDSGKNVTIIGDSITVRTNSNGDFKKKLKNADVYKPEVGKHMFTDGGSQGGTSGEKLIKELIDKKDLREIVVVALGTNDAGGLTKNAVQGLVDTINADGAHTIVFVTNYSVSSIDFTSNNNVFSEIKNTNSNVVIADWASAVGSDASKYMDDDVHPIIGVGTELFANTIYNALTNGVTQSKERSHSENCPTKSSNADTDTDSDGVTFADYDGNKIAFPIANATKDNISGGHGSYVFLSNLPCGSSAGCHYGEGTDPAFDICFNDSNKCLNDAIVVSIMDGEITHVKYERTSRTTGTTGPCNTVAVRSDYDKKVIAYLHMKYNGDIKAGTKVKAGDVIGKVSDDSYCHDDSTSHVHIDKNPDSSSDRGPNIGNRDAELVSIVNTAYEKLPKDEKELDSRKKGGGSVSEGGLTYEQAKTLMMNYGANKKGSSKDTVGDSLWGACNGGGSNCVTFSAFFYNKFTSNKRETFGNGNEVVGNLVNDRGVNKKSKPKVWSVFSWAGGSQGWGHTGVILGYENNEWIVGHASCSGQGKGKGNGESDGGGSGYVIKDKDIKKAILGAGQSNIEYADVSGIVDVDKIESYLKSGK